MKIEHKTETLLKRLALYDLKYFDAINKPRIEQQFGYSMRSYHANKVSNPPEWKIKDKAELIAEELIKRNEKFTTNYLKLNN